MKKLSLLIIIVFFLAILSLSGYLYLNEKIAEGSVKITEGQNQIAEGEKMLAAGKARLASGSQKLSTAKKIYGGVTAIPLVGVVTKLPVLSMPGNKIATGDQMVANGRQKIQAGEEQLAAGKEELNRGIARLKRANVCRAVFGLGSVLFAIIFIFLCWVLRNSHRCH